MKYEVYILPFSTVVALRTVLVVKAVPKYVTLNKALDFKITTLL